MKKYFNLMLAVPVFALAMISCSDDDNTDVPEGNGNRLIKMTATDHAVVDKCNGFGFKLMEAVGSMAEYEGKNFMISPLSANYAFSMLANGADGETRKQIIETLGYNTVDIADVNNLNKKLTNELSRLDSKVTLQFANSIWARPSLDVNDNFASAVGEYYNAEVRAINPATFINDINGWCSEKTNGKIPEFFSPGEAVPDFALFNAVYFKGLWNYEDKFNPKNTSDGIFNNADGSQSTVPFMAQNNKMSYAYSASMQRCVLRFGSSFSIAFVLPDEGVSVKEAIVRMIAGEWKDLNRTQNSYQVDLKLPKFKIESEIDLKDVLSDMGMTDVFTPSADYSNLLSGSTQINFAKQKSYFEINEEGAEAAAVTGLGGETALPPFDGKAEVTFNRPFFYVLYEWSSGAILFIGQVNTFAD